MSLKVNLLPLSNIGHLRQVYTGFHSLERMGLVSVSYSTGAPKKLGVAPTRDLDRKSYCLGAEIEGCGLVVYDVHDSDVIVEEALERAKIYFKRSYNAELHGGNPKIQPLGLNVAVEDRPGLTGAWRAMRFGRGRTRYGDVMRAIGARLPYAAREADLLGLPVARRDPRVLFLTRVWPPTGYYGVTPDETVDRQSLNEMRAECVRALRSTFGDRFTGGLLPDSYSLATYPDAVVADREVTRKDHYLAALDAYDVCIATRGLLGSTGWKFAEYLAKGRAIVSEPMRYTATGHLEKGRHFLEFVDAETCVSAVQSLFENPAAREQMMRENVRYYLGHVRPEALVLNSLGIALAAAA